ncbi:hypothetical protein FMZ60_00590 [Alcaligenaceae bacterium SJ-26]|nr:hypothetical protein FMZ60_00590 [Alcaligenaceae bacterium SJ-26]
MSHSHGQPASHIEIDLLALCQTIWRQKKTVLLSTVVCIALTIIYVFFLAKPLYEATAYIGEPFSGSLTALNEGRTEAPVQEDTSRISLTTNLKPYGPKEIFSYTTQLLGSDLLYQMFMRHVLSDKATPLSASELFTNDWRIKIVPPSPDERPMYKVSVYANNRQGAYDDLQYYLALLRTTATTALLDDTSSDIRRAVADTERALQEQRAIASQQRQDRIIRLQEALQVARATGLTQPQFSVARLPEQDTLRPYVDGSELYARGVQALEAEIKILQARKNDDAYIDNLREHEARIRLLKAIDLTQFKDFSPFRVDGELIVPDRPISPKAMLLIILAAMLGILIGITTVLLQSLKTKDQAMQQPSC